jgi:hypothetical protein
MKTKVKPRQLRENERILHRASCHEVSACACPIINQHNLPIDNDRNCICPEAPKPHAQHVPQHTPCDVAGCPNPARWYYPKPTLFGWNLCDTCKDTDPRGVDCRLIEERSR